MVSYIQICFLPFPTLGEHLCVLLLSLLFCSVTGGIGGKALDWNGAQIWSGMSPRWTYQNKIKG